MNLFDYLNKSHSPYQAVKTVKNRLKDAGFKEVSLADFSGAAPGKYYIPVYDTALFAVHIPKLAETSAKNESVNSSCNACDVNNSHSECSKNTEATFDVCNEDDYKNNIPHAVHIATAHTDSPTFKLKPVPDMSPSAGNLRINVEPYGGMLKRTWFDRPLGLAGAVWLRSENPLEPKKVLVDIDEPLFMIPSLAPHLDREIESAKIDVQKELVPIYGIAGADENCSVYDILAEKIGCKNEDILSTDLNLFMCGNAQSAGKCGEYIVSPRIDNIASVAALTESIISVSDNSQADAYISIICLFDNEEIGSRTKQGADSNILKLLLDKLNIDYEKSFIISVDGAQALHPNYPEKSDVTSTVKLGQGFAVKTSASQRYATDGRLIAVIKGVCESKGIPVQIQANRSGSPGGSTLGPIVSAYIPIPAIDIGIPMLAMHSACETATVADYKAMSMFLNQLL